MTIHEYRATTTDGDQILIRVHDNGTASIATRRDDHDTWSAPVFALLTDEYEAVPA